MSALMQQLRHNALAIQQTLVDEQKSGVNLLLLSFSFYLPLVIWVCSAAIRRNGTCTRLIYLHFFVLFFFFFLLNEPIVI